MKVLFIVPFVSKAYSADFGLASAILNATLRSLRQQTSQDFGIMVVSNDRPLGKSGDVIFAQTDLTIDNPDEKGRRCVDKERKIHWGLVEASKYRPEYLMLVDADDFVSRRLVEYVSRRSEFDGFTIARGYRYHMGLQRVEPSFRFHQQCGTNYLFRYSPTLLPTSHSDYTTPEYRACPFVKSHNKAPAQTFESIGWKHTSVPFFASIYREGHRSEANRKGMRLRDYASSPLARMKHAFLSRRVTPRLATEFGIDADDEAAFLHAEQSRATA